VVNGRPDVSDATRQRVQQVIAELGYQPSALARSLIQQRSYTLGVVTAGLQFVGPSRTLKGIASAAEDAGYSLLLKGLPHFQTQDISPIIDALKSRHVDGIIWAVPEIGDNRSWVADWAVDLSIPTIYLTMGPQENISVVSIDNYAGARMAVTHLLAQGFQHIGHLAGPLDWWESRERLRAWQDVLTEAGHDVNEAHWAEGNWSSASAVPAMTRLLQQYPEMDAVFVANDQMALAAMQVATQHGLRIPEDLGIIGFDNLPEDDFYAPPLSSIQQDQHEVGKIAMQEILIAIEAQQKGTPVEARAIMVSPSLVIRESSQRRAQV
jgi:LacI family transcriptional regulator